MPNHLHYRRLPMLRTYHDKITDNKALGGEKLIAEMELRKHSSDYNLQLLNAQLKAMFPETTPQRLAKQNFTSHILDALHLLGC